LKERFNRFAAWLRGLDRRHAAAWLALALVLTLSLWLRLAAIEKSLPYPQHIDESYIADNAANMLRTGDFNPHYFIYPGLPIYLTAAAMTYGYLDAANHLELQSTREIGHVSYPYYQHPRVVRPARRLFALISVAGMLLLALVARRLGGHLAMVLAPAWLAFSPLYFEQSQAYLNVNIVGSALAWTVIWLCLENFERQDWLAKTILPGLLCGLTIGSKYNFAAIVLAPLLAIYLRGGPSRPRKAAGLLLLTGAAFLLSSPYTLLDFKAFLDGIAEVINFYRGGTFAKAESATFLGHLLLNLKEMLGEFGAASLLFAAFGAFFLARNWRRLLVVAIFPLALFFQMCATPTHFIRNLVPFLPLWALLAAIGLVAAARALATYLSRWPAGASWPAPWRAAAAFLVLVAAGAFFLPLGANLKFLDAPPTSRDVATAWLLENAPKDRPLLVAREISLHPGPFEKAGLELKELPLRSLSSVAFMAELAKNPRSLVVLPRSHAWHLDPVVLAACRKFQPQFDSFQQELEPVQEFGSQPVSFCFDFLPGGDPQIVVGRPKRNAEELAGLADGQLLLPTDFEGEGTDRQGMGLAILAQEPVLSKEFDLPAGSHRLSINATGTPAKDLFPVMRVHLGDLYLGRFIAGDEPGLATFDFTLEAPSKVRLRLQMINDDLERDAAGNVVADRNVWLQGAFVSPAGAGGRG
jgi:hypothetical protein